MAARNENSVVRNNGGGIEMAAKSVASENGGVIRYHGVAAKYRGKIAIMAHKQQRKHQQQRVKIAAEKRNIIVWRWRHMAWRKNSLAKAWQHQYREKVASAWQQ